MGISPIQTNKPYSPIKTAIKTATTVAVGAGALMYLARAGKLNPTEGGNKTIEAIKATLKEPADNLLKVAKPYLKKVKPVYVAAENFIKKQADDISVKVKALKIGPKISDLFSKIKDGADDLLEKMANPVKFSPEKFKIFNIFE